MKKIKIRVYNSSDKFLSFLIYNKIYYSNLYKEKDSYTLIIYYSDIDKFNRFDIKIIEYYGIHFIKQFFHKNKYVLLGFILSFILFSLLCNTIFDVHVNSDDKVLVNKITISLNEYGILKYKKKKSFKELQIIKNNILNSNKDSLEWIEIVEKGNNYIIELTKRVIGNENDSVDSPSNIVASKDGLIKHISVSSGIKIKDENDYVKKGDILISGIITKGDNIVGLTASKGVVYAEVWYTVKVTIPFKYTEYIKTGKVVNHYYLDMFNNKITILGKYDSNNTMNTKYLILDKPYLPFDIYKEVKEEYKYKTFNLSEKEAYKEAILRADNNIKKTLNNDEYIMNKKVLRKEVISGKMLVEVFYKVYDNISSTSIIEEEQYAQ